MQIKQLEWEDLFPTVSSSVVSRAAMLGYTFEIYQWLTPVDENEENDIISYGINVEPFGPIRDSGEGFPKKSASIDIAKAVAQDWLEAKIKEVVGIRAAEIKWLPFTPTRLDSRVVLISSCGEFRIENVCGLAAPHMKSPPSEPICYIPQQLKGSWGDICDYPDPRTPVFMSLSDSISRCQAVKQYEWEEQIDKYLWH